VEAVWGSAWFWGALFVVSSFFNFRAAFKLLIDWKGMATTCRFIEDAYERLDRLPDEAALERQADAPVFLHLVPAYQEPEIAHTLRAILGSRYPHGKLHVVVVTKAEEDRSPHPAMPVSTAELVRRFRAELPPWQQKMLSIQVMPGPGRKAHQLNHALRPEFLTPLLNGHRDPARVYVGVSDADSIPDPNVYRWIAADVLGGDGSLAYQGVTLSLANFEHLRMRGRVCAVQQSSIFIRVSIARLLNERKRIALFARFTERAPRLARLVRPVFEFCFRRAQICLGHNQFVRLDTLQALGGFPTSGATEDSTLGYALAARGVLIAAMPMLELNDMPETTEKMVRQNARWYKGVLDDVGFLRGVWRVAPNAFNAAQLCRHVGNKVVEWPIAAIVYPVIGFLGWHLAYRFSDHPVLFVLGITFPSVSLGMTIWVGGIVTQELIESLAPYFPRQVEIARTTLRAKFWGIFRCQTYWLLATRGAWRVLWALVTAGRFEAAKTDRAVRAAATAALAAASLALAACTLPPLQFPQPPLGQRYQDRGDRVIGTIASIDANMGYVLVDFSFGRLPLSMDQREMAQFRVGEPVVFDHDLRPIWSARPGASDVAPLSRIA
jgi:cellulose synthase/poly-beta-1,6-N-acetylglucosamine synthase-like glycosyltransferase